MISAFNQPSPHDDFNVKLKALLQAEGKTLNDVQVLFTEPQPTVTPEKSSHLCGC